MEHVPGSRFFYEEMQAMERNLDVAIQNEIVNKSLPIIVRNSIPPDQSIPEINAPNVLRQIGDIVERFFTGNDFRQAYSGTKPLSAYAGLLNHHIVRVQYRVLLSHERMMKRKLKNNPDIIRWLETATTVTEFESNPLAQYQPAHTWVDARGYRLSDRVWRTSVSTRTKIDGLLLDAIRSGTGSLDLSRLLERFVLPSRQNLRTRKPYGVNASFDAMRLARTEIGRAHTNASYTAGLANPFVDAFDWALSARHPKPDICDTRATIGMSGERLKDPMPISGRVYRPFEDSHPQCLCNLRPVAMRPTSDIVAELRARMRRREPAPITPINALRLLTLMVGATLASVIALEVFN